MKNNYNASGITQEILTRMTNVPNVCILDASEGNGYEKSLEKEYLSELRGYLRKAKEDIRMQRSPVIFVSEDSNVARQACIIWKKYLEKWEVEKKEQQDSDYEYDLFPEHKKKKVPTKVDKDEIVTIRKRDIQVEEEEAENRGGMPKEMIPWVEQMRDRTNALVRQADAVLVEYSIILNPDEACQEILQLEEVPKVAVSITPRGSYEYFIKRLAFEGDFQVVMLGKPSLEEYVDYANSFLTYFGYQIERQINIEEVIKELVAYRGSLMKEGDIYRYLGMAFEKADLRGEHIIRECDLKMNYDSSDTLEEIDSMIGLDGVKSLLVRFMAAKKVTTGKKASQHLLFAGKPGTGKSCMARAIAKTMGRKGISNGKFVDASRSELIGKYVGHTAVQIRKIFEKAEGGVLFIDEASFLLEDDKFVQEAVIELVRYMELYPQTTVIFATYPEEAEKLLHRDSGLSSRIYKVIPFETYNNEEMWEIARVMAKGMGFEIEEECKKMLEQYLDKIREQKDFGNAREVRKLLQAVVEEYGLMERDMKKKELNEQCFEKAIKFLNQKESSQNSFGFRI